MPHHKSASKRIKTSAREREQNRAIQSRLRGLAKEAEKVQSPEETAALIKAIDSAYDKATKKRVMKRETAGRHKSRLNRILREKLAATKEPE